LKYTDPSGHFVKWLSKKVHRFLRKYGRMVVAIAAAAMTGGMALAAMGYGFGAAGFAAAVAAGSAGIPALMAAGAVGGFVSGAIMTGSLKGAVRGAIFGALSAGIARGISLNFNGVIADALHGVAQGTLSEAFGGDFKSGFIGAFVGHSIGGRLQKMMPNDVIGRTIAAAVTGGIASKLGGGKFANGAVTGAFVRLLGEMAASQRKPTYQSGKGGVAFVGGFFDKTIHGPVLQAYEAYTGDKAYFQWYESEALGQWIDANGGNVSVIGHSYGADMAAEVVAAGHAVNSLRTVDPVGWIRPDYASVAANSGSWVNYNATGAGATWPNFVATVGGAWNGAPSGHATHINAQGYDHAGVCFRYCTP
jgi:hypothetical protein